MAQKTHQYTNNEVTVVWKPDACIHSSACWRGLGEVFAPKERPWIKMDGASTDRIIGQVRKCPSGALSYFLNKEAGKNDIVSEAAQIKTTVEVSANGPYLIATECVIKYSDGRQETKAGVVALCRCGASKAKPYCDGSHNEIGFEG